MLDPSHRPRQMRNRPNLNAPSGNCRNCASCEYSDICARCAIDLTKEQRAERTRRYIKRNRPEEYSRHAKKAYSTRLTCYFGVFASVNGLIAIFLTPLAFTIGSAPKVTASIFAWTTLASYVVYNILFPAKTQYIQSYKPDKNLRQQVAITLREQLKSLDLKELRNVLGNYIDKKSGELPESHAVPEEQAVIVAPSDTANPNISIHNTKMIASCSNCANVMPVGAAFCPSCGQKIQLQDSEGSGGPVETRASVIENAVSTKEPKDAKIVIAERTAAFDTESMTSASVPGSNLGAVRQARQPNVVVPRGISTKLWSHRKALGVAAITAIIVLPAVFIYSGTRSSPSSSMERLLAAVEAGNSVEIRRYYDSESVSKGISDLLWNELISREERTRSAVGMAYINSSKDRMIRKWSKIIGPDIEQLVYRLNREHNAKVTDINQTSDDKAFVLVETTFRGKSGGFDFILSPGFDGTWRIVGLTEGSIREGIPVDRLLDGMY